MKSVIERMDEDRVDEKIARFRQNMTLPYEEKVAYALRRATEFAQECDRRGLTWLMCYIQLSLLGCAGYVVIADTLSYPVTGWRPNDNQGFWYTPAFALNPAWPIRLEAEECLNRKIGSSTES